MKSHFICVLEQENKYLKKVLGSKLFYRYLEYIINLNTRILVTKRSENASIAIKLEYYFE